LPSSFEPAMIAPVPYIFVRRFSPGGAKNDGQKKKSTALPKAETWTA
jgi:hypothetical protein